MNSKAFTFLTLLFAVVVLISSLVSADTTPDKEIVEAADDKANHVADAGGGHGGGHGGGGGGGYGGGGGHGGGVVVVMEAGEAGGHGGGGGDRRGVGGYATEEGIAALSCRYGCCGWGPRKVCRKCCTGPQEAINNMKIQT